MQGWNPSRGVWSRPAGAEVFLILCVAPVAATVYGALSTDLPKWACPPFDDSAKYAGRVKRLFNTVEI
jgi:hypothetical protein